MMNYIAGCISKKKKTTPKENILCHSIIQSIETDKTFDRIL